MGLFAMEGSLDFTLQSMGNHWYIIRGFIYLFNWVLTRVSQDMNYIKHTHKYKSKQTEKLVLALCMEAGVEASRPVRKHLGRPRQEMMVMWTTVIAAEMERSSQILALLMSLGRLKPPTSIFIASWHPPILAPVVLNRTNFFWYQLVSSISLQVPHGQRPQSVAH